MGANTVDNFKNFGLELEDCFQGFQTVFESMNLNYEVEKKHSKEYHLKFENEGLIRIYNTNKGISLDESLNKNKPLGLEICRTFDKLYTETKITGGNASYTVPFDKFATHQEFVDQFEAFISSSGINLVVRVNQPHTFKVWEITNGQFDNVVVSLYNSRSLTVLGKTWTCWKAVCGWIEEKIDAPVKQIIARFAVQGGFTEQVESFTTSTLLTQSENAVQARLGTSFNFLYHHDQSFMTSAYCVLQANLLLPEFSTVVMPVAKAFEGYFKRVLIHNNPSVQTEISKSNFSFSKYFDFNRAILEHEINLSNYGVALPATKVAAINLIYKKFKEYRHLVSHSGPPVVITIDTNDDARSRIDAILGVISSTYPTIA